MDRGGAGGAVGVVAPAPVRPDRPRRPAATPVRTPSTAALTAVALLVVVGNVGWRRGEYFTGSLDPVVVAKAAVGLLALAGAFLLARSGGRHRVGTGSVWWLGALLGSAVLGAVTRGDLVAGGTVAVRVALVGATVLLLTRAAPAAAVLTALVRACVAVAVVAAVTGAPSYDGRLAGGVPAIDPNELALLASLGVLVVAWRVVAGRAGPASAAGAAVLLGVVWATGSRTALLVLVLAVLAMALHIRRPQVGVVVSGLVLVALAPVAVATTGAVAEFLTRGGDGTSTLGSRLIAWRAALTWADSSWQTVFGGGLNVKIIRVQGQYWDTQPLDSSWVSLLVQAGWSGVLVGVCWVLWTVRGVLRAPRGHRVLFVGLLVFLLGRSVLESGLFDATVAFLLFLAVSLLAEGGSRDRLRAEEPAAPVVDAR